MALKAAPLGAPENVQVALALFDAGAFDDAARHLRRALAATPDAFNGPPLSTRLAPGRVSARLDELAPKIEKDTELCFLAGALCLMNGDRARTMPLLLRAEELAGADAQANALCSLSGSGPFFDRNRDRAVTALHEGIFDDAARCFAFAALDCPTVAEHYAGAAIAFALCADKPLALRMRDLMLARARFERLIPWLRDLKLPPTAAALAATAPARDPAFKQATLAEFQLAACVALAHGMFGTTREALVGAMLRDKLDMFSHEVMRFLESNELKSDPPGVIAPDEPQPRTDAPQPKAETPAPAVNPIEEARKAIRRREFSDALKLLDPLAKADQKDPAVFLLVFVCCVGRDEPQQAADALQAWFSRVDDKERARLNTLRELFDRAEHFEAWRKRVLTLRDADPNASLPRLINAYIEFSAGAYAAARTETQVALIGAADNAMLKAMQKLLERDEFQRDASPPSVADKPTAQTLLGTGLGLFRRGEYAAALAEFLKAAESNPKEPKLCEALLRAYFALGDYARTARQVEALLTEQQVEQKTAEVLQLSVVSGYDSNDDFEKHLAALKKAATERTAAADENLVLGAIQFSRGQWADAATALTEWKGLSRAKELNPAVLKLLEAASKKS